MADKTPDYLESVPPEKAQRLYGILTGQIPACPECGKPLDKLVARTGAIASRDAWWGAVQLVRKAMINRWTLARLAESMQTIYEVAKKEAP